MSNPDTARLPKPPAFRPFASDPWPPSLDTALTELFTAIRSDLANANHWSGDFQAESYIRSALSRVGQVEQAIANLLPPPLTDAEMDDVFATAATREAF